MLISKSLKKKPYKNYIQKKKKWLQKSHSFLNVIIMKDNSDESDGSDSDSDSDKSSKDSDSESGSESEEEKSSGGLPKFLPKLSHTSYSYSNKNRTCTWSGSSWQGTAVATKTSKYAVKLGSNCGYLMLGFANPKNLNKFSSNYSNGGYYLYTSTGGLYGGGSSNKSFTQYDYNVGTIYGFIYDKKKRKNCDLQKWNKIR